MTGTRGGVWRVVARELKRATTRPLYGMLTIMLPLLTFAMFTALFSANKASDLPVAVCDKDCSSLSRKLIRFLDATQSIRVASHVNDIEEGKGLIEAGKVYALFTIPEQMERSVYAGKSPKVIGYFNNQYLLTAGAISRDMLTVVGTVSAGINLKTRQKKGESLEAAMERINPITVDSHTLFNPSANNAYYLVPMLLPNMLQVFVLLTTIFAFGIELREGTGKELLERAGGSIVLATIGKMFPYTILFFVLANVANGILFLNYDLSASGSLRFLTVAYFAYILAYQSLGVLLVALCANFRLALSIGGIYCSPAFAFAGATFPIVAMPVFGKVWSAMLPMTYFFQLMIDQLFRGAPMRVSMMPLAMLCFFALLGPGLMLPRLKQLYSNERYWGAI